MVGVHQCINHSVRRARLMEFELQTGQPYNDRKQLLFGRTAEFTGIMDCEFLGFCFLYGNSLPHGRFAPAR